MKKIYKYTGVFILLSVFILSAIWSFIIEPEFLLVKKVSIEVPKWHKEHKNLKFAVLADFHIGFGHMNKNKLSEIIKRTNKENPDIVILLGDYVNQSSQNEKYLPLLKELGNFKSKYGIFAIMGNHESWEVRHKIRKYLKKANIKLLENDAEKLTVNKKDLWIAGVEDLTTGFPDIDVVMDKINDNNNPAVLLSHNPDIFDIIPERFCITLAGHTHGGQLYIPFLVRLVTPSEYGMRFLKGHVVNNNRHIYISSGLGTTIIPARFLVPPEIIILRLE